MSLHKDRVPKGGYRYTPLIKGSSTIYRVGGGGGGGGNWHI